MRRIRVFDHLILSFGVLVMMGPVAVLLWRLCRGLDFTGGVALVLRLWNGEGTVLALGAGAMMWNSMVVALGVAALKTAFSLLAAFALVFFRLPAREWIYGALLLAMFFPIETRILPSFAITAKLGLLNSYAGMILPVAASGLGVLIFTQFMKQLPPEVVEAARIDGAGPVQILRDILLPMSLPMVAALFAILFVMGWNQYVWPIMITTTSLEHDTLVRGMAHAGFGGRDGMALALLSLLPPGMVLILTQRWLVRGLTAGIH